MEFRLATANDYKQICLIYDEAIQKLKQQKSPQWQNGYGPNRKEILKNIQSNEMFVLTEWNQIFAVCTLILGEDPVYTKIDGKWQSEGPYLTIHRVAVKKEYQGQKLATQLLRESFVKAKEKGISDVRIDTFKENLSMKKVVERVGFVFCGEVTFPIPFGERDAYQIRL